MKLDKNTMITVLNHIYDKAIQGLPTVQGFPKVVLPVEEEVQKERAKYKNKEEHIDAIIKWAILKSTATGFISSVGGAITLPVAVPAGLIAVLYIQLRMIAKIAYICGYDIKSEEVKTAIYCCLTGSAVKEILKSAGIKIGQKLTQKIIASISGKVLRKINKAVGFRLVTKLGYKGVINLGKMVPIVSGLISAYIDRRWCRISGKTAKKWFYGKTKTSI